MKIWFDTEFIEDGKTIDLISIGLVREDGATYYAEIAECDHDRASPWVRENVFPHLTGPSKQRADVAREIVEFVGPKPEFWAYFADYDWVALCQLFGTMMDLPDGWPMFCLDVKQVAFEAGNPQLQQAEGVEHHALADAKWTRAAHLLLQRVAVADFQAREIEQGWVDGFNEADDKAGGLKLMVIDTLKRHPAGEMVSDEEMAERQRDYLARLGVRTPRH